MGVVTVLPIQGVCRLDLAYALLAHGYGEFARPLHVARDLVALYGFPKGIHILLSQALKLDHFATK